jgi:hypothetical protein
MPDLAVSAQAVLAPGGLDTYARGERTLLQRALAHNRTMRDMIIMHTARMTIRTGSTATTAKKNEPVMIASDIQ